MSSKKPAQNAAGQKAPPQQPMHQRPSVFGNNSQSQQGAQPAGPSQKAPQQQTSQSSQQQQQQQQVPQEAKPEASQEPRPPIGDDEEEMPATERDLADDAPWKRIQQNTFTRWANEHLKTVNKQIGSLETDLADGLRLIALIEVLSGKILPKHNKRPNFRSQKLENVSVALTFLQEDENIKLVNIDSSDLVDGRLKLILGLIWTLILHYSISMPMWADEDEGAKDLTPKQRLLRWIQNKVPDLPINNFTGDWNDGRAIGALVDAVAPGLCPDWADWSPKTAKKNATEAMKLADDWLGVPQLIRPEDMVDPNIDEQSMMTYLSQFPNAKLRPGAPLHGKLAPNKVRAYGPGLEPGNRVGAPAKFTVETFSAGLGTVDVQVIGPDGQPVQSTVKFNNDRTKTYSCQYIPKMEGHHRVTVHFSGKDVPKSPFDVDVRGYAGDASKVTAKGPGIEPTGNQIGKQTFFEVFTKGAGEGVVEVIIMDQNGKKDTVVPIIKQHADGVWSVHYTALEQGLHSVNVFFAGKPIPLSPFGVKVGPVSDARKVRCTGRGLQKNGVRVKDVADFKVWTEGAGEGKLEVKIIGPGGVQEHFESKKIDSTTTEFKYFPKTPGRYTVIVMYGGQEVPKSPFEVNVGKYITSRVRAFGPGLEGGVVGHSADFSVEMNGETAPLGFSIEGPSQAKIDCKDNGDQTADVKYWPTAPGEYAVHVLCNDEDIPNSPFMAQIINMPDGVNPDRVKVFGPGVEPEGVQTGRPTEFTIDCREAGKAPLHVTVMDNDYNPVNVTVRDLGDGTYKVQYTATRSVKHTVQVNYSGVGVPKSPFRVYVQEPTNPGKVRVYGPGVEPGVRTATPTHFTVDCAQAGPGDVQIALQNEKGQDVPFKINDNRDGTFTVDYTAPSPGTYKVTVSFAGKEVPASPIKVQVAPHIDVSGIRVEGLEPTVPVNSRQQITISSTGQKSRDTTVPGQTGVPTGISSTSSQKPGPGQQPQGSTANWQSPQTGQATPTYADSKNFPQGGQASPSQLDKKQVIGEFAGGRAAPGADSVKGGPGSNFPGGSINTGSTGQPIPAGPGGLKQTATPTNVTTASSGAPGLKQATPVAVVTGVGKTVPFSLAPKKPAVAAEKLHMTALQGPHAAVPGGVATAGKQPMNQGQATPTPGQKTPMTVHTAEQGTAPVLDLKDMTVEITTSSGKKVPVKLTQTPDGKVLADFIPTEIGESQLMVKVAGMAVPNQPQKFTVSPTADASKVKVDGPGIKGGEVGVPAKFRIDSRKAGVAPLGLNIDGPAEVKIETVDNKDGTVDVTYHPTAPGEYDVRVTFDGKPVPNSPFKPKINAKPADLSKVKVEGPGLKGGEVGAPAKFRVDSRATGVVAPVTVKVNGPAEVKTEVVDNKDGTVDVTYHPTVPGEYDVNVLFDSKALPTSPYKAKIVPRVVDASKVIVDGPGLRNGQVGVPAKFRIDSRKAGVAPVGLNIDGPAEVKIETVDNKDGTVDVTYHPTAPGDYDVKVTFDGKPIPSSPFKAKIIPKPGDLSKVKVEGPGLKGGEVDAPAKFRVDSRATGVTAPVTVKVNGPAEVKTEIVDNKDGTVDVIYHPTVPGEYDVNVLFDGKALPVSPFKAKIVPRPVDASKVIVDGPGLRNGQVGVPAKFRIDSRKAGVAPLGLNIDGPAEVKIETVDNKDGTVDVTYHPTAPGDYDVKVTFDGKPVPNSPFKAKVISQPADLSKVKVDGLGLKGAEVGVPAKFRVDSRATGVAAPVTVKINGPVPVKTEVVDNKDGTADVTYHPTVPGEYDVNVLFDGKPLPVSPVKVKVVSKVVDASKVKVDGPGIHGGEVGVPAKFRIDTRSAGVAPVGLGINGPVEVKIETVDNKDGTVDVTYHPTAPGEYDVNVTFDGKPVPSSPFKAKVVPKGGAVDLSGVKVLGPGIQGAFLDSMTEFTVDARSVTRKGEGKVKVIVTSPTGIRTEALVANKNDGTYTVDYSVFEEGRHTLEITYDGIPVPGSPYKVQAVRGSDHTKCKAYGPGLQGGYTHVTNQFTVETKGAGTGGLALAIEGPSEAKMTCKDNRDGTCLVDYTATESGEYDITIKFADKHIPGSPFKVNIDNPVDSSRVRAYGPGVEPNQVRANIPANFKIDATKSGRAPVAVDVTSDRGPVAKKPEVYDNGDGTFNVSYLPPPEGANCKVRVTHGGQDIPGSPFQTRVLPTCEPQKVVVSGPGVNKSGVPASIPAEFIVDTREAGYGDLKVSIEGPDGKPVRTQIEDLNDGTYKVRYVPEDVGNYKINVLYGNQPVKGAPFNVKTYPTGDASKVKIMEGINEQVVINQEYRITVNTTQAGVGNVTCKITGQGQDCAVDIQDNGDGTISLFYTLKEASDYTINIKFGGQPVPGGTFKVKATTEEIITQKTVERTTTRKYRAIELKNIPLPLGGGNLTGLVTMPSGKQAQPELVDNKDGNVTCRFQPSEAGQHELSVKYSGNHLQGSPFKFFVDQVDSGNVTAYGPGLTHGIAGEPQFFTINTREAGSGGLSVAVEGPSKADITCQDNRDGTCSVNYLPLLPGEYKIIIKFGDKHIAGSPFSAKITGTGKRRNQISVGTASEISLMVKETDIRTLLATIKTPSGLEEPCMLKLLPNGHLGISFTPREVGEHQVLVTRNGKPIQGSPFKVQVGDKEIGNASRVKVIGNAVKEGKTQQLNEFVVDTKQAGYGGLSVSVEGPSKADIQCSDNADGTLKVGYKPTEPGQYTLNVRFADQNVPGSPFCVKVSGEGAHRQTERYTHTTQTIQTSHAGKNCELNLKLPGSDPFDMRAQVTSPSGKVEDAEMVDLEDSTYKIKFVPAEVGLHTISVKQKNQHIPGSPFQFTVGPLKDGGPHRVHAGGPGLERGEVGEPCDFNIWTREAGAGNLSIAVEGPSKAAINFKDHKDGSCFATYKVKEAGEYSVSIKYNEEHIPDSPFRVYVTPSIGEAKKIEVGMLTDSLPVAKPAAFTINTHGVKGKLAATVVTPSGKEEDCVITPVDDNVYAVRFMPYDAGIYFVNVKFNGAPVRGSPFRVRVGKEEADPAQVFIYGKGIESAITGEKAEFVVNTLKAGAGTLAVTIDGPSKVSMDCSEVDEGYKIRYTPLAAGDYFVAAKYNGLHIGGSPYRVPCSGKGRAGSVVEKIQPNINSQFKQSSSVVVETVTKSESSTKVHNLSSAMHAHSSDATKVVVKGVGSEKAYQNKQNTFTVKADAAGPNVLLVGVFGNNKPADEVHVKHTGHDAYQVSYLLRERGEYLLIVKYGDDHVPGSPFYITCA